MDNTWKKNYLTGDEISFIVDKAIETVDSANKIILVNGVALQFCVNLDAFNLRATSCNLVYDECAKRGIFASDIKNYNDLMKALEFEDGLSKISAVLADESFKEMMNKAMKEADK